MLYEKNSKKKAQYWKQINFVPKKKEKKHKRKQINERNTIEIAICNNMLNIKKCKSDQAFRIIICSKSISVLVKRRRGRHDLNLYECLDIAIL